MAGERPTRTSSDMVDSPPGRMPDREGLSELQAGFPGQFTDRCATDLMSLVLDQII